MAIQRAEDKTLQMQARAGAVDELIASGALDDASSINRGDDISRELDAMSSQSDVEAELAALKGGSPAGDRRPARRPRRPRVEAPPRPSGQSVEREQAMIVRILGEGQLEVADDQLERLNALDAEVETAVEAGDEERLHRRARGAARRRTPRRDAARRRLAATTPT